MGLVIHSVHVAEQASARLFLLSRQSLIVRSTWKEERRQQRDEDDGRQSGRHRQPVPFEIEQVHHKPR